jgi:hypothetical protein
MATKQELVIEKYTEQLKKIGVPINKVLLETVTKGLGPANYKLDSMFVAASDTKEIETVYKNFIIKKCGAEEKKGRKALEHAMEKFSGVRKKYRGAFYYVIAKKLGIK